MQALLLFVDVTGCVQLQSPRDSVLKILFSILWLEIPDLLEPGGVVLVAVLYKPEKLFLVETEIKG